MHQPHIRRLAKRAAAGHVFTACTKLVWQIKFLTRDPGATAGEAANIRVGDTMFFELHPSTPKLGVTREGPVQNVISLKLDYGHPLR